MNPLRLFADLLYRLNRRRQSRELRRRRDAAVARYEQRHARCLDRYGEACPGTEANGDCHA